MNGKYQWKGISQFLALLTLNAALAACGGSNISSGTSAANDSSTNSPASGSGSATSAPTPSADSVTLSWTPPDENTDGTVLANLAGYEIHYGTSSSAMTEKISINTAGVADYVVTNLSSGTWYFEIIAVNSDGTQSAPSGVASATI